MDYKLLPYLLFLIVNCFILIKFAKYFHKYFQTTRKINEFCETIVEEIPGGAYYYRSVADESDLTVTVVPRIGDPDLYISYTRNPTYHLESHDQNSCTCGEEELKTIINTRPLYVGVYCYTSYFNCTFELNICSSIKRNIEHNPYSKLENHQNRKLTKNPSSGLKSTFLSLVENFFVEILPTLF